MIMVKNSKVTVTVKDSKVIVEIENNNTNDNGQCFEQESPFSKFNLLIDRREWLNMSTPSIYI